MGWMRRVLLGPVGVVLDLHDTEQRTSRIGRSLTGAWEEIERLTERVQELERDAEQSRKTIAGCMTTLASDGVLSADQIEWITEFAGPEA